MSLLDKRRATRKDLNWFGLLMLGFFLLIGGMAQMRGHHHRANVLWIVGVVLTLIYYAIRPLQKFTYDLWMGITYPIGWVISHALMAIMFFGVITPIGLLMRLFGRDPMERQINRAAASYWVEHDPSADPARYFRQF